MAMFETQPNRRRRSESAATSTVGQPRMARFALTVKPRTGSITYLGSMQLQDVAVDLSNADHPRFELSIDPGTLDVEGGCDPRWSMFRFPFLDTSSTVRLRSLRAHSTGGGRFAVAGEITNGVQRVAVDFVARLSDRAGSETLTLTAEVDHRGLGVTWLTGGPVKTGSVLVVRFDFASSAGSRAADGPRDSVNDRYRFMANGSA